MHGRDYALPDDVKALAEPVLAHRLVVHMGMGREDRSGRAIVSEILETVPVPGTVPVRPNKKT